MNISALWHRIWIFIVKFFLRLFNFVADCFRYFNICSRNVEKLVISKRKKNRSRLKRYLEVFFYYFWNRKHPKRLSFRDPAACWTNIKWRKFFWSQMIIFGAFFGESYLCHAFKKRCFSGFLRRGPARRKKQKMSKKTFKISLYFLSEFKNAILMFIHSSSDLIVNKIHSR